ncbi:MAG: DUF7507 domain-containing protein [Actinomycetota bacterium]
MRKAIRRRAGRSSATGRVLTAFAVLAGMLTLFVSPSSATTLANTFELDGNPQSSGATGDDWETLISGAGGTLAKTAIPIFDGADAPTDTTYWKGGGSKDVNDISQWAYSGTDVAPDKNEIVNAAAAAYRVPDQSGGDADTDDDLVIAFHADRFSNDGDAAAGFWFFKSPVELANGKFVAPGGATATHTVGDVLVVSDFNEGEGVNTIRVFTWNGSGLTEAALPGGSAPKDCQDAGHNAFVCATENRADQDDLDALWQYDPKANVGIPGAYPDFTFLEGAINMSAVLPGADQCFASFLAETRSSTSPTAQLKDFVIGDFPICRPSTTLSAAPSVASPEIAVVGDPVTFSWTETNDGNVTLTNVHVTTDSSACTTSPASVSLAPGASQVFSCTVTTGATPAVIDIVGTGHGTDPVGRDTTFCAAGTAPANTVCDAQERATARAVTILPGTELSASADPTIVKQGDTVTYTITEANDGVVPAGTGTTYSSYLALTSVTVTASSTTAGVAADCNNELGAPISGNSAPTASLDAGETWTYQCTVTAPSDDFTIQFNGSGVALAGSSPDHAKTVNFAYDSEERASVPVTVISPSTQLTITASAVITYTFVEVNDSGDAPLTPPTPTSRESMISLEAGSALCNVSPVVYVSGDTGNDKILGVGEAWTFTCQGSLAGPTTDTGSASSTLVGIGSGTDATNSSVTYPGDPDERDRVTVTITNHQRGATPPP